MQRTDGMRRALKKLTINHRLIDLIREIMVSLPRRRKRWITRAADLVGLTLCACATEWLLFETTVVLFPLLGVCVATAIVAIIIASSQGMYRSIVRYMGLDLFVAALITAGGASIAGAILMFYAGMAVSPIRWAIVYACTTFIYLCSSRYIARLLLIKRKARTER